MLFSLNFREAVFCAMVASLVGMLVALTAAGFWFALPSVPQGQTTLRIGNTADIPPSDRPYKASVWAEKGDHFYHFWVVNVDGELIIFDGRNPGRRDNPTLWRCVIAWESANGRFVDPCSGDKYALSGEPLAGQATGSYDWKNYSDRGLDQVEFEVLADGEIVVYLASLIGDSFDN